MFVVYNYFRQYNADKAIIDYKNFYQKFSNEREFGGKFSHYDHLVKNRFVDIVFHLSNVILRKSPCNILDVGCGSGINLPLSRMFPSVDYHGLDYAEKTIENSRRQYPNVAFHVEDAFNMAFPDKLFDMVILSKVLILYRQKQDRINLLTKVSRVLKDDGIFVLVVNNESFLLKKSIQLSRILGRLKNKKLPEDFMGLFFKFSEIKSETKKANLKIEEFFHTSHFYGVLESVRYLNMSKYNRIFGKSESEAKSSLPQNILEDLEQQAGCSKYLTKLFFYLSKIFPYLFSSYSIYVLSKIRK